MKKLLEHYYIGDSYGGDQEWFDDWWMYHGGCGAVTACECCIYLARHRDMPWLYPFDAQGITKEDFLAFGMYMKSFLSPRSHGINSTQLFIDGFGTYLATRQGPAPKLSGFQGTEDVEEAVRHVRAQIDAGLPVPYLMLLHTNKALEDYNWHWFVLNGYDDSDDRFMVRSFTYGEPAWFDLRHLWDTGHREKGGIVLMEI